MSQVTLNPQGLVAALGLRDMGAVPRSLSDVIAPTVDVLPLFLIGARVSIVSNNAAVSLGNVNFADLVVPPGELWYVHEFSVAANLDNTEACTWCAAVNFDGQANVPTSDYLALGVAAGTVTPRTPPRSSGAFLAGPGSTFGANVFAFTGTVTLFGLLSVTRLRV